MVGGYTEDLKKPQNCQNWRVGACETIWYATAAYVTQVLFSELEWLKYVIGVSLTS